MSSSKGIGAIPLFMIVGLVAVISAWIFFIFFKVHITGIAVDIDSINRYQEVPTAVLLISHFIKTKAELDVETCSGQPNSPICPAWKDWFKQSGGNVNEINCFNGNGPAGSHNPNEYLCTKRLAFYYNKFANGVGRPILGCSGSSDSECELISYTNLRNTIRASLPDGFFRYSFEVGEDDSKSDTLCPAGDKERCSKIDTKSARNFKLNELYPIPIFSGGEPTVASQRLFVESVATNTEKFFVNWPRYST